MTPIQKSIYDGLSILRPELASFFKEGIKLKEADCEIKSYLLAHILREIDGGLRGILDPDFKRGDDEKEQEKASILEEDKIVKEFFNSIFEELRKEYSQYEYLKNLSQKKIFKGINHAKSIISAFELSVGSSLAVNYIKYAIMFNKYAHRDDSTYDKPRNDSDILRIWGQFECVLFELVGKYNSLQDRFDKIISREKPSEEVLKRIDIMIREEVFNHYFFTNLKSVEWLKPLYTNGIFKGKNNPGMIDHGEGKVSFNRWYAPIYLNWIAENTAELTPPKQAKIWALIVQIIDDISTYRIEGERNRNGITDSYIYELIKKMPREFLEKKHFDYLKEFATNGIGGWWNYDYQMTFLILLLNREDKRNMLFYLETLFAYDLRDVSQMTLFGDVIEGYKEDANLFENGYTNLNDKIKNVVGLCGITGFKILYRNLLNRLKDTRNSYISFIGENETTLMFDDSGITSIVFTIRDYLLYLPTDEHYAKIVKCLLKSSNNVIKRVGYYMVAKRYDELKDTFWTLDYNPFNEGDAFYELYHILKLNAARLNPEEMGKMLHWLEIIEFLPEATPSNKAQTKKQYLAAFKSLKNDKVTAFQEECDKDYPREVSDTDFMLLNGLYGTEDATETETFTVKNLRQSISCYSSYKKVENKVLPFRNFNPLTTSVQEDINRNPDKYFLNNLGIQNADRDFQKDWLGIIENYIRRNPSYQITAELLQVIQGVLDEMFWTVYNTENDEKDIYVHIIERILSLFELLLNNNMIPCDVLGITGEIISTINHRKSNDEKMEFDSVNHNYLHSIKYLLTTDLIIYAYNIFRCNEKSENIGLDENVKAILDNELSDGSYCPFFYFGLTSHLSYLRYVESDWVNKNLDNIFCRKDIIAYSASIKGWLLTRSMDNEVFFFLRESSAFDYIFSQKEIFGREFVRLGVIRICSAYIKDMIDVNDPLIELLIRSDDNNLLLDIIVCFSNEKKVTIPFGKIEVLWKKIMGYYVGNPTEAYFSFADNSFFLLEIYNPLTDEVLDIVEKLVSIPGEHRFYSYIEKLLLYLPQKPERITKILSILIRNNKNHSTHRHMEEKVKWLFDNEFKDAANEICEAYASKGNQELRTIYKKYKKD